MNTKDWSIPFRRPDIPVELLEAGFSPLLSAVLALRGCRDAASASEAVNCGMECVPDPLLMSGMAAARDRILLAVRNAEHVAVYGDYDVDGITSTCLLTDYLRSLGLECTPYIPDRSEEGYGINKTALDTLHRAGVTLVVSVDCGITAIEETRYAASLGIDMIITDHHECKGTDVPEAVAVIDCKQPGDSYPNKNLAGVGVALKLVCACDGDSEKMFSRYADLAAVGTVADVMPLVGENRYIVRLGLEKLTENPRPGIAAMLAESSIDPKKINSGTIGFSLAPRLNAAGRLGKASTAGELLMTDSPVKAAALAAELCDLNRQRQSIENSIWSEANAALAGKVPDAPIVLASDRWHQGVIGIAASRLAEQYSLPAIMICLNDGVGKGSCRSYGGFNLFEALSACSEHLIGFGGHALAAGLNIEEGKLDSFRQALAEYYRKNRPEPLPEVSCDLHITDPELLSVTNVRSLDVLEPFGNLNPKPVMCMTDVELVSASQVGGGKHLRLRVQLGGAVFEGIFFSHTADALGVKSGDRVDVAFSPQINEYHGRISVQLMVCALRLHDPCGLCAQLLEGNDESYYSARRYCPDRSDFICVWRSVEQLDRALASDLSGLLADCPAGLSYEKYIICLRAFFEAGLLESGSGDICGCVRRIPKDKADLDSTRIMNLLKALRS